MAVDPNTLLNGTIADANEVQAKFDELFSNIDPTNVPVSQKVGSGRFLLESGAGTGPSLPPIGSIIAFYDFNAGLTFNSTYWAYCNGQVKNVGALVAQTLPDLSNRYLVGFGTEGGADNGSAAWATPAVGAASHQISLAHAHTVAAHTHTITHTHTTGDHALSIGEMPAHTHDVLFYTAAGATTAQVTGESGGNAGPDTAVAAALSTGGGAVHNHGSTGASSAANTGSASPATDSQLSATQSIQPRSIRVRWIMRIL